GTGCFVLPQPGLPGARRTTGVPRFRPASHSRFTAVIGATCFSLPGRRISGPWIRSCSVQAALAVAASRFASWQARSFAPTCSTKALREADPRPFSGVPMQFDSKMAGASMAALVAAIGIALILVFIVLRRLVRARHFLIRDR